MLSAVPKSALADVALLSGLDEGKLRALSQAFAVAGSAPPSSPELVETVATGLALKPEEARSVVVAGQSLLALVEQRGTSPAAVLDDLRELAAQHDTELAGALDAKRPALEQLFTPGPRRLPPYYACEEDRLEPIEMDYEEPLELLDPDEKLLGRHNAYGPEGQ